MTPVPAPVPEYVLVPKEPTLEMLQAVDDAYGDGGSFEDMWDAALLAAHPSAAPSAQAIALEKDALPCWLVEKRENGRTVGFLGYRLGMFEWMATADEATRFVRRQDANGAAECFEFEDVILAEHIWG